MVDCAVIGGGQAGLAASYHLGRLGVEHVVLERGRVAETWRSARWDGFHLNTPNWATRLPGFKPAGADPDSFAPLAEVIDMLEAYAERIDAPVRAGVEVTALRRVGTSFELDVDGDTISARSAIVATGAFQQPTSAPVTGLGDRVLVTHTSAYRSPGQLPEGGVLIVGSGQSGCEIAQELIDDGREVHLSVGRCPWAPRRHRGRELIRWMEDVGLLDDSVDALPSPSARVAGNVTVSGARGGCDCHPLLLEAAGAQLHGRMVGLRDGRALFADDLDDTLQRGLTFERDLRARFDEHAAKAGLDLPPHHPVSWPRRDRVDATELSFEARGVTTIMWANGYRPGFGWVQLPIFDNLGFPRARRGVTDVPGLAFLGLPWLHTRRSPLLIGVGGDAEHVAGAVAEHLASRSRA
jgi:putative flavoprotein involved in K+ transport